MTRTNTPMDAQRSTTVAVWTPWGVQSLPQQEVKAGALKRLAGRLSSMPKPQGGKAMQA